MSLHNVAVRVGLPVLALGIGIGVVAAYGVDRAPRGAGVGEAVRVALDPGVEYAVLAVEGMT